VISGGTIRSAHNGLLHASLPGAAIGAGVRIRTAHGPIGGIVTALHNDRAVVAAHGAVDGVAAGDAICTDPAALTMPLGTVLLGRAIGSSGYSLDDRPRPAGRRQRVAPAAPTIGERRAVDAPFWTGVRAIDGLLTIGRGARVGIFGAPGAGKSTFLQMLVDGSGADAVVIGLTGERGREAEEWSRRLAPHVTLICATSDLGAAERVRAAEVAAAQAASLRKHGLHVLLVLDSLARYAGALRELGVASGESVGRAGYPPSVFANVARLVEVAGAAQSGSVTLVATVLSDGDARDPVSEAARSLLDGHFELSAALANAGRFPAIDLCASASRTMSGVTTWEHLENAALVRAAVAQLERTQDARALGMLPVEAAAVRALNAEPAIESFLRQGKRAEPPEATLSALSALADTLR
jgi:ATP synthase in type III secretion protein N